MNDETDLTHIDLFSGIGGFSLAAGWVGFRTIAFCEIDPFCQEVLKARFGAVADTARGDGTSRGVRPEIVVAEGGHRETIGTRYGNQNNRTPLIIPDIFALDGTRFRGATLLTGGFPCQPFSHAGKRRGKEDDRAIWPQMLRVIHEARPAWVIGENVSGLISMELDQVLADLEMEGYATRAFHIGAVGVNAPHRRMRVWIVAHTEGNGTSGRPGKIRGADGRQNGRLPTEPDDTDSDAPDAEGVLSQGCQRGQREIESGGNNWDVPWIEVATSLCRVDDGLPAWVHAHRVARLKALGNAIVPQVAYQIIKAIADIEREVK